MDSYYTSLPLFLQLSYWGIQAIGTLNLKRKGFGKEFEKLKKKLKKDVDPKGNKPGGYKRGYFRSRGFDENQNITVTVQKDSKVMVYLCNFLSSHATAEMDR